MPSPRPDPGASRPAVRVLRDPPAALRWGAAIAGTAAALGASLLFREFIGRNVFIFFFVAVILVAWFAGRGPALLVTAFAVPLVSWFFLPPFDAGSNTGESLLRLTLFAVLALLIGSMRESLDESRRRAEASAREAEEHAVMLQDQTVELEQQAAELEMQTEEAQSLADDLAEAHRQLQESSARQLAEAQAMAHMGSWEWAVDGDRVAWSDELYRVYGYTPGALEVTLERFMAHVHPDDRERMRAVVEHALATGEPFDADHRIVRADGEERVLHARGRVEADAQGRPVRMLGTGQDVTAARAAAETEQRLAAERAARAAAEDGRRRWEDILEGVGESFVTLDREWRYTWVNGRAEATLRRARAELLGKTIWKAFPALREGTVWTELHRVRDERVPRHFEFWFERLGLWLAIRAAPWEDGISIFYEDVTDRRRAEEEQGRLAAIVESSHDAIFAKSLEGIVLTWNAGAERLYGYTAGEIVGRSVADLAPPDRGAEIAEILRRVAAHERVDSLETVRQRKDGTLVDVMISVSPVLDAAGNVVGASTIARRAETSVRFLAEASRVLGQSLDRGTVLAEIAQLAVPRLADYCVVALADGADGDTRRIHTAHDDPAKLPVLREVAERYARAPAPSGLVRRVLDSGEPALAEDFTAELVRASGADDEGVRLTLELAPRSVMVVPLRLEARLGGIILLATSHSGRRYGRAEVELAEELARRAATALENARLHGAERRARRAAERAAEQNARLQAVTAAMSEARTPGELADAALRQCMEALGAAAGWLSQISPDGERVELLRAIGFPAPVVEAFRVMSLDSPGVLTEAVRTGEIIAIPSRAELERRFPDVPDRGQRSQFGAWTVTPLRVEGRTVGAMALNFAEAREFDEETRGYLLAVGRQAAVALERARLFEAERVARAEAEAANRAKFDFLTTMSHELRTPLNAIAGYVDLLDLEIRGPVTPEQREDLARIRRSQTHLLGLINDVLNFARIETGHVNFALADVPLDELLLELETLVSPQLGVKGLTYEYRRFDSACTVRADPEKLRQIVLNLLSNAVKFTPPGGRVTLWCEEVGDTVRVHVGDTGIGIPDDKLGSIFDPFVQVNAGYTRTSEGTGLGLSISRDLARAMGGDLTVDSREGEGSTFTLTLPRGAR
jgi:PAS domain S-box-containing protein